MASGKKPVLVSSDSDSIDWETDDEHDVDSASFPFSSPINSIQEAMKSSVGASSSTTTLTNKIVIGMETAGENCNLPSLLESMGYDVDEALQAIARCGPNAQMAELIDFIYATRMDKELNDQLSEAPLQDEDISVACLENATLIPCKKKRKLHRFGPTEAIAFTEMDSLPKSMKGFGVPGEPSLVITRNLPEMIAGPPYFYFENVALAPKGVWSTMSRFLYEIEPEFVDSRYFSASVRKRGYIHNLPIHDRFPLLPLAPLTIHEALPSTKDWWPSWDPRTKLNCIVTRLPYVSDKLRLALKDCNDEPTPSVRKFILEECRKSNLIWIGRNKLAPLEPHEIQTLLGFPKDHTRGYTMSKQYKALGNSFQVDTVAYHLSVLKHRYPHGINVLSLFSGIGGAEVALYRLGMHMKNVVSVEKSETNRNILRSWWTRTQQQGRLIEIEDIQKIHSSHIKEWIDSFSGFDLIIGGSPCNNLSGMNRVSRIGLEGAQSRLFYEYWRILSIVRSIMRKESR